MKGEWMNPEPVDDLDVLILGGPRPAIRFTQADIIEAIRGEPDPTGIGGGKRVAQRGPDGEVGKRSFRVAPGIERRFSR